VVSLACHDLRTPLATIYGFARTLSRSGGHDERTERFLGMIEQASEQMTELLDELAIAARIASGRWEPALRDADTLALATADDERVLARGTGATVSTDPIELARALKLLGIAAARFGGVDHVTWQVEGRTLELSPVDDAAKAVLSGEEIRDLGSLVAWDVIEALGGTVELDGGALRVRL
jgi:signal transduction histidine kinase